jgi:hypothetical protein
MEGPLCQGIGREMREAGIEAFEYYSARSVEDVIQMGAISCCVFTSTPFDQVEVVVEANGKQERSCYPLPGLQHGTSFSEAAIRSEWSAATGRSLMNTRRMLPAAGPNAQSISGSNTGSPSGANLIQLASRYTFITSLPRCGVIPLLWIVIRAWQVLLTAYSTEVAKVH